jgi:hypothetical protein
MRLKLIPIALFVVAAFPIHSQVVPAGTQSGLPVPIVVGGGVSYFSVGYPPGGEMLGVSAWADWFLLNRLSGRFQGLGIAAEGHEIAIAHPSVFSRMKEQVGEGGAIYSWTRTRNFHPYGKFLAGIGGIYFPPQGAYTHDTRTVYSPGGGIDYRLAHHILVRGDYEYQIWHHFPQTGQTMHPNGFTLGASYDFRVRNMSGR